MPIQRCYKGGKPGYRWGKSGKCYTYTPGDEESRQRAYRKAREQEKAIRASGWSED